MEYEIQQVTHTDSHQIANTNESATNKSVTTHALTSGLSISLELVELGE